MELMKFCGLLEKRPWLFYMIGLHECFNRNLDLDGIEILPSEMGEAFLVNLMMIESINFHPWNELPTNDPALSGNQMSIEETPGLLMVYRQSIFQVYWRFDLETLDLDKADQLFGRFEGCDVLININPEKQRSPQTLGEFMESVRENHPNAVIERVVRVYQVDAIRDPSVPKIPGTYGQRKSYDVWELEETENRMSE